MVMRSIVKNHKFCFMLKTKISFYNKYTTLFSLVATFFFSPKHFFIANKCCVSLLKNLIQEECMVVGLTTTYAFGAYHH